jgi:putative transposase
MPRKTKTTAVADKAATSQFSAELLEQLIPVPVTPAELEGIFQQFRKSVLERALGAEMSHHLGYAPGQTVLTDAGALRIDVPRDREGTFEPQLIGKHERRFTGFDDKIIAMYARGMTVREIQGFLAQMYAVDVSPDLISRVTDAVMSEVTALQSRPLESMYPVVFFDALRVKIREDAVVRSKAVYLALSVLPDGSRDILGIWIENTEGAKFWMKVFNDLKTRGVHDILIATTGDLELIRNCHIPDDCIDTKRYPLFMARAVLKELIESLQSIQGVKPC